MHLTEQTLTVIGIPLLTIPALVIGWSGLYCGLQAANNLKPDSKWPSLNVKTRTRLVLIPRSELTETGLWYRRHAYILSLALYTWVIMVASLWYFAIRLMS